MVVGNYGFCVNCRDPVPRKRKSAPREKESTVVPAGTDSREVNTGVNRELFTELGTMVSVSIHAVHFCCFCDTAMFRSYLY